MDKVEYEGLSFSPVAGILFVESDSHSFNLMREGSFSPVAGILFVESCVE